MPLFVRGRLGKLFQQGDRVIAALRLGVQKRRQLNADRPILGEMLIHGLAANFLSIGKLVFGRQNSCQLDARFRIKAVLWFAGGDGTLQL